jgi:hypothetical protein
MPDTISFSVLPKDYRDSVKSIDVIDSGKILGFNTYNDILTNSKT